MAEQLRLWSKSGAVVPNAAGREARTAALRQCILLADQCRLAQVNVRCSTFRTACHGRAHWLLLRSRRRPLQLRQHSPVSETPRAAQCHWTQQHPPDWCLAKAAASIASIWSTAPESAIFCSLYTTCMCRRKSLG